MNETTRLPLILRPTTLAIKANYPLALIAWCPECEAMPGAICVSHMGRDRVTPHARRVKRADKIQRNTLQGPRRPGEPQSPEPDCEQLPLVGYTTPLDSEPPAERVAPSQGAQEDAGS